MTTITEPGQTKTQNKNSSEREQLPLQFKWTLWYNGPSKSWKDKKVKRIGSFATVPYFWSLFNNICTPSQLNPGSDYHLFKGTIKPEWEDPFNQNGGSITYRFAQISAKEMDKAWFSVIFHMIGNQFEHGEDICGVVVSVRKHNKGKIALWIKDAKDEDKVESLAISFKNILGVNKKVSFQSHQSAKSGSYKADYEF